MEYAEVVKNINQAYWQALMENHGQAQQAAANVAITMGLKPEAAETMVHEFTFNPLQQWLKHRTSSN